MWIEKPDDLIQQIVSATFGYRGKQIQLKTGNIPTNLDSYWDGGSKDSYCFYELATSKVLPVHSNHPFFEPNQPRKLDELPKGLLLVQRTIFLGKDLGITIYCNPEDMAKQLTASNLDLSADEKLALEMTVRFRNSYGGRTNIRFEEATKKDQTMTKEKWEIALASLREKKLLNKANTITLKGRNAVGG